MRARGAALPRGGLRPPAAYAAHGRRTKSSPDFTLTTSGAGSAICLVIEGNRLSENMGYKVKVTALNNAHVE